MLRREFCKLLSFIPFLGWSKDKTVPKTVSVTPPKSWQDKPIIYEPKDQPLLFHYIGLLDYEMKNVLTEYLKCGISTFHLRWERRFKVVAGPNWNASHNTYEVWSQVPIIDWIDLKRNWGFDCVNNVWRIYKSL